MYILLGLSIVLAALLLFNSLASLFATLLWRIVGKRAESLSAASCASIVFFLRTFPVVLGSASRLASDWLRNAEPIELPQVGIRAYQMQHQFPVIAIVGILRPRLFIANQILMSLAPAELTAAILHETGHVMAYDNLRRGLMRACRDVLLMIPCGRLLDRAWVEASEAAADEYAADRGRVVALDLASALVKIARLIPVGVRPAMPAGAFLIGADEFGGVKTRVRRLMQLANEKRDLNRSALISRIPMWVPLALTIMIVAVTASNSHVLASIHTLIEHAVYFLD